MLDHQVVSTSREDYGDRFHGDLLEQYKLMRSTITELQNDRNTNNRFLIGICSALFGLEGLLLRQVLLQEESVHGLMWLAVAALPILGGYISFYWIRWGRSYGKAMRSRYQVLKGMETHLPSQPFTREYDLRSEEGYVSISDIAITMSRFFLMGFILLFLFSLLLLVV